MVEVSLINTLLSQTHGQGQNQYKLQPSALTRAILLFKPLKINMLKSVKFQSLIYLLQPFLEPLVLQFWIWGIFGFPWLDGHWSRSPLNHVFIFNCLLLKPDSLHDLDFGTSIVQLFQDCYHLFNVFKREMAYFISWIEITGKTEITKN